jgi:predicted pyridoxine 5'-phosphate oxidase superfamily flavin-nucleotide-binding protein
MFSEAAKQMQEHFGSRRQYDRVAELGAPHDALGPDEREFIAERDSFYLGSVTVDGWPYIQHRGGPRGFLRVLDDKTLAFADFAGNRQFITVGDLATNDRVSLFLMDYRNQARLKVIGHARLVEPGTEPELDQAVAIEGYRATVERIMLIDLVAFDWNCSQHITPRYSVEEIEAAQAAVGGPLRMFEWLQESDRSNRRKETR